MALIRILVDGYNLIHAIYKQVDSVDYSKCRLLHNWPELARGKPRHSAAAREALVQVLTHYQDVSGTPVTIFFDGAGSPPNVPKNETTHLEVLFSKAGQTADDLIERAAYRFQSYGEVLAVTDDYAERDTVIAMGGTATSCDIFINMIEDAQSDLADDLKHHNRTERNRYHRSR